MFCKLAFPLLYMTRRLPGVKRFLEVYLIHNSLILAFWLYYSFIYMDFNALLATSMLAPDLVSQSYFIMPRSLLP